MKARLDVYGRISGFRLNSNVFGMIVIQTRTSVMLVQLRPSHACSASILIKF
jgi:hypothetical protein